MEKYKYAIIFTLIFFISYVIVFYKIKSDNLERDLKDSQKEYSLILDKLKQQEKSITEYKESIKRQDEKLKSLNENNIKYEKELNYLKKEVSEFNIKESIKTKPVETKKFITEKINKQFNEINEITK